MPNNYFKFKQFTISQQNAAMKVGTDGVLLGAWTDCSNTKLALDIGTGTGLIALMLAQRCSAKIDAIDIEKNAIDEARQNINQSPWSNKINVHHISIQNFSRNTIHKYDLIVSNPPFFENSLKAEYTKRTIARHTDSLPMIELFNCVKQLLNPHGKFTVIIPSDSIELYQEQANEVELYISNILWVKPTPTKPIKRVLIEFTFTKTELNEDTLVVEKYGRHKYSEEYIGLTKDFYLKF